MVLPGLLAMFPAAQAAEPPLVVTVSVPGPHNLSYLPIDLIPRIGADRAEGLDLRVRHTAGGGITLRALDQRNIDFAVAGVPAMMSLRANGGEIAVLAAISDLPVFVLAVRADLRQQVKSVADLRGRAIGIPTGSLTAKTASQQLLELVLASAGVSPEEVRIVPAGQSWRSQSAVLESGIVDAILGNEPFASRFQSAGKVFFLLNFGDHSGGARIPGGGFLHAALATRPDVISHDPAKVGRVVAALKRSLAWIATHSPEEIVAALDVPNAEERESLIHSLRQYRRIYTRDGAFSARQLRETEQFFRKAEGRLPAARELVLESMIADKWVGKRE